MGRKVIRNKQAKEEIVVLRRNLKDTIKELDGFEPHVHGLLKFTQDLYMTCNVWLFTEDAMMDPAKLRTAAEDLLILRGCHERIIREFGIVRKYRQELVDAQKTLSSVQDAMKVSEMFMNRLLPQLTTLGENFAQHLILLKPIRERHLDTIKERISEQFANFFDKIINESEENLSEMKKMNLTTITPEDVAAAEAGLMEAAEPNAADVPEDTPVLETEKEGDTNE